MENRSEYNIQNITDQKGMPNCSVLIVPLPVHETGTDSGDD
jgi:hypothetical protein